MRGRWCGWVAVLAIAAAAGCDDEESPARGFRSRQLVSTRDPTLFFVGFASTIVTMETEGGPISYYSTDRNLAHYATGEPPALTYWELNLTDNTVTALGDHIPTLEPTGSPRHFLCRSESTAGSGTSTLFVADPETMQDLAVIDRVVGHGSCPRYPDGYLAIVRLDENDVGRLSTGRFDRLARAELDLAIDAALDANWTVEPDMAKWRMTVLGAAGPAPAGSGIYEIDLAQLTTTTVIPPALAEVTWASGATPSGAVGSDGLRRQDLQRVYVPDGSRTYVYRRAMNDGSEVMFAGPLSPPSARELALFPIAGDTASVHLLNVNAAMLGTVVSWYQAGAAGSDADLLVHWDTAGQRIISCPFAPGTLPPTVFEGRTLLTGFASPDRSRYAFAYESVLRPSISPSSSLLVELSTVTGSCRLLAARNVKAAALADDALAWVETLPDAASETLWLARAPGDPPRALGSMAVVDGPQFIAPHTLKIHLGTDLAWLDVRDDPVQLHYMAEHVFGMPSTGPRWLVTGYGLSSQDDTGTLGVVEWQAGGKQPISPAVLDYMVSSPSSSTRPLNIVYRVRGRSASSQDGIWAATIEAGDLPDDVASP